MSRVRKRFLIKVGKAVGAIAYVLGSMFAGGFIASWLGFDIEAGILVGAFVMVILPMVAFLLHDVYRDTKQEVEREDRAMWHRLQGE
jgi:ABC-type phosphate transport system permease subunit